MKCYNCHQLGHPTYRCPKKSSSSQGGERRVNYIQEDATNVKASEVSLDYEVGEMMRRFLIKEPIKEEPSQRRSLFRIKCKIIGKVCKVVADFGSIDNIVSKEIVSKLNQQRIPHSDPYRVT